VFADPRNGGRPVYFSDVVVAAGSGARRLDELRDRKWAVNDDRSLSGFGCVIAALGPDVAAVWSGGHDASVEMVLDGSADCASVDANYLRRRGTDGLRVVHTFGPHPIQPLVARPSFERVDAVVEALCGQDLTSWGVVTFAAVDDSDYPDSLDLAASTFRSAR
jgi:ABC-type phosphate/phosphonate transport system substrate-binding protein